jgi:hypothetical protein
MPPVGEERPEPSGGFGNGIRCRDADEIEAFAPGVGNQRRPRGLAGQKSSSA